jgi:hypothetical protein
VVIQELVELQAYLVTQVRQALVDEVDTLVQSELLDTREQVELQDIQELVERRVYLDTRELSEHQV